MITWDFDNKNTSSHSEPSKNATVWDEQLKDTPGDEWGLDAGLELIVMDAGLEVIILSPLEQWAYPNKS